MVVYFLIQMRKDSTVFTDELSLVDDVCHSYLYIFFLKATEKFKSF